MYEFNIQLKMPFDSAVTKVTEALKKKALVYLAIST